MSEICVFAGTTEGRRLVECLVGQPVKVCACVAISRSGRVWSQL